MDGKLYNKNFGYLKIKILKISFYFLMKALIKTCYTIGFGNKSHVSIRALIFYLLFPLYTVFIIYFQ